MTSHASPADIVPCLTNPDYSLMSDATFVGSTYLVRVWGSPRAPQVLLAGRRTPTAGDSASPYTAVDDVDSGPDVGCHARHFSRVHVCCNNAVRLLLDTSFYSFKFSSLLFLRLLSFPPAAPPTCTLTTARSLPSTNHFIPRTIEFDRRS